MKLREVLRRLPALFDRGAFAAACHEIRRVVPIDQLGIAHIADDGSHFRVYVGWTSPDLGVPDVEWGQRIDSTREQMDRAYRGAPRVCRDTRSAPGIVEPAFGAAGILCTLSVPIGAPLAGVVGFGFRSADMLDEAHLPILRKIASTLVDRLDWSLLSAHAARLRLITEAMPMGAIMLAGDGTVEEINPAAARLAGREPSALVGRSIRELVCAPDGGLLGWRIDEPNGPAPARVRTADGAMRPVLVQLAPLARGMARSNLYGPLFLVDTSAEQAVTDALERRTAELRRLELQHRRLVDDLPVVVYATDGAGRCIYISRAIERILGYTPDELYAMESFAALNVDEVPSTYNTRAESFDTDFRLRCKDGREIVMHFTGRVLSDSDGNVLGSEGFAVDVTSERDAQRKLLLADRLAALGLLVAGIGHEINNPAAYVSLGVQQIARHLRAAARQGVDETRATLDRVLPILDDVAAGVHRIAEIVGELKLFARSPDADVAGSIDLNGVVRSAATLVQAELRSRARLQLELGELPPAPGSWARLSQVALNLLINAAQAIAPGAPERNCVTVTTSAGNREVRIVVRDTGAGIGAVARARIFDPFYTTKSVGEGTGLGLAISYDIVQRLGGTIAVDSELGRGSTFTVTLPESVAPMARTAHAADAAEATGSVLVVDDERALGTAIARELGARMQVELVHSGGDALLALARGSFDAVLCDLRMPGLSGAEVYRRTHARDRGQAERFVFITGAGGAAGEAEFLRLAGQPVLEKPFAMADLWRAVGAVVGAVAGA